MYGTTMKTIAQLEEPVECCINCSKLWWSKRDLTVRLKNLLLCVPMNWNKTKYKQESHLIVISLKYWLQVRKMLEM